MIVAVAVERDDTKKQIERIRLHVALDFSKYSLETSILNNIENAHTISTNKWTGYNGLENYGYYHEITDQSKSRNYDKLFAAHLVTTQVKMHG